MTTVDDQALDADGATITGPKARRLRTTPGLGDRVFHGGSWLAGLGVLAIMGAVGLFLLLRALSALKVSGLSFLTTSEWQPDRHHFGIAAVLSGTVLIALVAVCIASPLALGTALFISEVAPRRLKQTLRSMVDLMAAIPSVVYGLWGLFFLQGHVIGVARWLSTWLSWIPIFKITGADPTNPLATKSIYTASTFIAGIVVALMVMPIQCSIMREVFSQAPAGEREGAFALGATRWHDPGGGPALRQGWHHRRHHARARPGARRDHRRLPDHFTRLPDHTHILQTGSNSVSSLIALRYGDASGLGLSALMAAGLALFVLTLIVNFTASSVVARSRSDAESDA